MIDKKEMEQVVEQFVADKDLFLVEINIDHSDNIVEVLIDSMDSVTLDDCVAVNDAILEHFDRDREDFELTVASYGISDPFRVTAHYNFNAQWLKELKRSTWPTALPSLRNSRTSTRPQ